VWRPFQLGNVWNHRFLSPQVGLSTGQAFASLEDMLIFFYDMPFPDAGNGHVPLTIM
jgi:hypothetical protein